VPDSKRLKALDAENGTKMLAKAMQARRLSREG
jgi:hypothetical protein